jgi:cysteinyl-tRNA synthetase
MDLIFPHHENEIAQAEAAHPGEGPFAHSWMHNGFVNIDKEKMSKSLGNFVTMQDVFARNDPEALRLFLLQVHYRGPIQFDTETLDGGRVVFPGVDEAERRVDYLYGTLERLSTLKTEATEGAKLPKELVEAETAAKVARHNADAALADDLNTTVAIAELGEMAKHANEIADLAQRKVKDTAFRAAAANVAASLQFSMTHVISQLGILQSNVGAYRARTRARRLALRGLSEKDVDRRVADRVAARGAKDFARADALRAELSNLGVELHDSPGGSTWSVGV